MPAGGGGKGIAEALTGTRFVRAHSGDAEDLRAICGTEGKLCSQCPFGAYLPSGFPYASETQALCLPWIVVVHPMPG